MCFINVFSGGHLLSTDMRNCLNWTSLEQKLSSRWSNLAGKTILLAGQFSFMPLVKPLRKTKGFIFKQVTLMSLARCMRMPLKQSSWKQPKLFIMKKETDICRKQMWVIIYSNTCTLGDGWAQKSIIPACPLYNQLSKLACPGQVKVYLFSFLVPRLTTCGAWALAYQASYNEQFKLTCTWYENLPVLVLDNQTFF